MTAYESYFLADQEHFGARVLERYNDHLEHLRGTSRHHRMLRSYRAHYGRSTTGGWDTTTIESGGRRGESKLIKPNEYRNLLLHMKGMAVNAPPAYDPQAINSDAASMQAASLSTGLIDYYTEEQRLGQKRAERAETALVFGESWQIALWDPNEGAPRAVDPDAPGGIAREGDFRFHTMDPYDFAYDPCTPDKDNPAWAIFRVPRNRWDMAAQFPQHEEMLKALEGFNHQGEEYEYEQATFSEEDYAPVYYVYALPSPAIPQGRQALIVDGGDGGDPVALFDGGLEYRRIPGARCAPENIMRDGGGYSPGFDLLAPHEASAALVSTITTNQTQVGGSMLHIQRGSGISVQDIGTMKVLETKPGFEPKAINLLHTPPELFTMLDYWQSTMERLGVISKAARGDSEAIKGDSGKKVAMVEAASSQFSQGFARALRHGDATIATHLIHTLVTHATTERVTTIAGKRQAAGSRSFIGADLKPITRVLVRPASPYRDTQQGRRELLNWMTEGGYIKGPDDIHEVLNTGRLEPLYEQELTSALNIRQENEILGDPGDDTRIHISPYDDHPKHIQEHSSVLNSPEARSDAQVVIAVSRHIEEHMMRWRNSDPAILAVVGIAPPPPPVPPGMTAGDAAAMGQGGPPGPPQGGPPQGKPPGRPPGPPGPPVEKADDLPTPPDNPLTGEPNPGRPMM